MPGCCSSWRALPGETAGRVTGTGLNGPLHKFGGFLLVFNGAVLLAALFGLLSYVEPVLLVVVALLLGETIVAGQWLTYGAIWAAIGVLVVEGAQGRGRNVGQLGDLLDAELTGHGTPRCFYGQGSFLYSLCQTC